MRQEALAVLAAGVLLAPPPEPFELDDDEGAEDDEDEAAVEPLDEPESPPEEDESDFAGLAPPLPVSLPEVRESVR
ncbi:hypothetical protein [Micromonospora sp. NPDC002717]|uniref:hypothetical protein n=1 Tax=Micromonospora sp. NPDC002717 TaxID=3154424 RepID=UPI003319053F